MDAPQRCKTTTTSVPSPFPVAFIRRATTVVVLLCVACMVRPADRALSQIHRKIPVRVDEREFEGGTGIDQVEVRARAEPLSSDAQYLLAGDYSLGDSAEGSVELGIGADPFRRVYRTDLHSRCGSFVFLVQSQGEECVVLSLKTGQRDLGYCIVMIEGD